MPHKGVHVAVEAFAGLPAGVDAELHVWGSSDAAGYRDALAAHAAGVPRIRLHGAFAEEARVDVLRGIDVLIVPSIGWESFGLVAREAWQQGVPVMASRRSALTELFPEGDARRGASHGHEGGALFAAGDAADLARLVTRVVAEPGLLDRWRLAIPAVTTVDQHAPAIDAIYDAVIRQRR